MSEGSAAGYYHHTELTPRLLDLQFIGDQESTEGLCVKTLAVFP